MELSPDIIRLIGYKLDIFDIPRYTSIYPQACGAMFLQRFLDIKLGVSGQPFEILWNMNNYIYPKLTPLDRFIRILAYFNIVVPGSEKFLLLWDCEKISELEMDPQTLRYFHPAINISSFYDEPDNPVLETILYKRGILKETEDPALMRIANGELVYEVASSMVTISILYDNIEQLNYLKENMQQDKFNRAALYGYILTGNLEKLENLYNKGDIKIRESLLKWAKKREYILPTNSYKFIASKITKYLHWILDYPLLLNQVYIKKSIPYSYPTLTDLLGLYFYALQYGPLKFIKYIGSLVEVERKYRLINSIIQIIITRKPPELTNLVINILLWDPDEKFETRRLEEIAKSLEEKYKELNP